MVVVSSSGGRKKKIEQFELTCVCRSLLALAAPAVEPSPAMSGSVLVQQSKQNIIECSLVSLLVSSCFSSLLVLLFNALRFIQRKFKAGSDVPRRKSSSTSI